MPAAVTETVTIINNSGKVISTGKHIFGIFEKAKNSYHERKAALKADRAYRDATKGKAHTFEIPRRAHTFDVSSRESSRRDARDANNRAEDDNRRRSFDDTASRASSRRSHKSHRSSSHHSHNHNHNHNHNHKPSKSRRNTEPIAEEDGDSNRGSAGNRLTADNLKALGAVTTTESAMLAAAASKGSSPPGAHGEHGEEVPGHNAPPRESIHRAASDPLVPVSRPQLSQPAARPKKKSRTRTRSPSPTSKGLSSDEDLAYGFIPSNLANRTDLDPQPRPQAQARSLSAPVIPIISHPEDDSESSSESSDGSEDTLSPQENEAKALAERIQDLLDEAQCIHHSATAIITHLQEKPEAAAAVALTLAELSALVAKMSPAFLPTLKGAAPVVFGLLASPHFLVAAGVAVGVTVVIFGGLKILKRIVERNSERMAFEARAMPNGPGIVLGEVESVKAESGVVDAPAGRALLPPPVEETVPVAQLEEVIQKELSGIERWRRGIPAAVEDADQEDTKIDDELLSPEAREAVMGQAKINPAPILETKNSNSINGDVASVSGSSTRSSRSHRSERSTRSWSTYKSPPTSWGSEVPDRRSSRKHRDDDGGDDDSEWWDGSSVGSLRSSRTHRTHRAHRTDRSSRTGKTHRSSSTSRREKHHKSDVIGEVRSDDGNSGASELKPVKPVKAIREKKDGILKNMFRRKLKEDRESQKIVVV